jgi:hypothetical protein
LNARNHSEDTLTENTKWTTDAEASSFIQKHHKTTDAVMAGERVVNPPVCSCTKDDHVTRAMLDRRRNFILLVADHLGPLVGLYGPSLEMLRDPLNREGIFFAMELHDNFAD